MFREDIKEGFPLTRRWLGWGDVRDWRTNELIGTYFFIQFPSYKMVLDCVTDKMVMGKLTFTILCCKKNYFSWADERYIWQYYPVYDV